jgi:hypothetical protein
MRSGRPTLGQIHAERVDDASARAGTVGDQFSTASQLELIEKVAAEVCLYAE